jgi:2-octaprenyl-6-methoxyphenol hydroxylase
MPQEAEHVLSEQVVTEHIVIVGGGPIGLTTALLLARAGYRVTVIEGREAAAARADRRLLALSRGTWQVLAPLLMQNPQHARIDTVLVSSAGEFGSMRIDATEIDAGSAEPLGVTMRYGALCHALEQAIEHVPATVPAQIALLRPARAKDIAQRNDAVTVTLDDGRALEAALLLHAEGAPGQPQAANASWALLADVALSGPAPGMAFERFTREGPLALLPAMTDEGPRWSLVWCSGQVATEARRALTEAEFVAALQAAIGMRTARVLAAGARQAVRLAPQMRARIAEHRLAWLGNAAQTLHPVAGQGFNLGVRDACTLLDALRSQRVDSVTAVPSALREYARRRATDRRLITGITNFLPSLFATRALPLALGRSLGLTLLDLTPPLRRQWAQLLMFGVRS